MYGRIRSDDYFSIYRKIDILMPKPCPNKNRRTFWRSVSDLHIHIKYHCRLIEEEKQYFYINNDEICVSTGGYLDNADYQLQTHSWVMATSYMMTGVKNGSG